MVLSSVCVALPCDSACLEVCSRLAFTLLSPDWKSLVFVCLCVTVLYYSILYYSNVTDNMERLWMRISQCVWSNVAENISWFM